MPLFQYFPLTFVRYTAFVLGVNSHIRKTRNGKIVKRATWNSRRVDQRLHTLNRIECKLYWFSVKYFHYNIYKPFLFSCNRKYSKQIHNIIPFLSSYCPCQLHVARPFCDIGFLHQVTFLD